MIPREVWIYCRGELVVARQMSAGAPFVCSRCGKRVKAVW